MIFVFVLYWRSRPGFLVARPRVGHLDVGDAEVEKVDGVGPAGWALAVTHWLATIES